MTETENQIYRISGNPRFGKTALITGIVGLILSFIGFIVNSGQFYYSWLVAFMFWASIGIGALFFTMLHHLVGARWSIVLRRISESIAWVLPFMVVFFIPVLLGLHDLYHWSHSDIVAEDSLLQSKSSYLNVPFFIIRAVIYFGVWFILAMLLNKFSIQQDNQHSPELLTKMRRLSAGGMILFAATVTFSAFDWLMSLDAHWYSTIFGVYIFSGALVGILCFLTLIALYLRNRNILSDAITIEHYHDLGKLTFAFTVFWAYMAFSQYFLIWYANIPEETIWFLHRWEGSWKAVSLLLVFGHFIVPFFILITRSAKRNLAILKILVGWLFFMHFVDLHWIVLPTLHHHGLGISWIDITTIFGIGGIFCWLFWRKLSSRPLVPVGDPDLSASIKLTRS
jgi:hypothetical protein